MLFCTHIFGVFLQVVLVFACVELWINLSQQRPLRARAFPIAVLVFCRHTLLPDQRGALQELRQLERESAAVLARQEGWVGQERLVFGRVRVNAADP